MTNYLLLAGAVSAAVGLAASTAVSAPTRLSAPTSAFSFPKPRQESTSLAGTDGFEFRPTRDILVVSLGYYDGGYTGLATAHRVTLYETDSRRRIAYATIDQRGRTMGRFRYRPIQPRLLKAGTRYTIAGYHPGPSSQDKAVSNPVGLRMAPAIGYQDYTFNYGPAPAFPDQNGATPFFGPSFQFRESQTDAS